ncbi:MAG: hypothetical protein CL878_05265 [Dehalococcoidia bacterium]|nr:hypothetical protein [Dehalococcoidia bacterium]
MAVLTPTPPAELEAAPAPTTTGFFRETVWPSVVDGTLDRGRRLLIGVFAWMAAWQVLPGLGYYPDPWPTFLPFFVGLLGFVYPLAAVLVLGVGVLLPLLAHAPPAAFIFLVAAIILLVIFAPNWPQLLFVVSAAFFGNIGFWFLPPLAAPLIWGGRRALFVSLGALLAFAGSALGGKSLVAGFLTSGSTAANRLDRPLAFTSPLAKLNEYGVEGSLWSDFVADLERVLTLFSGLVEQPHALFEVASWAIGIALMLGISQALLIFGEGPEVLPPALLDLIVMGIALLVASVWLAVAHWTVLPLLSGTPMSELAAEAVLVHTLRSFGVAIIVAVVMRFLPLPAQA